MWKKQKKMEKNRFKRRWDEEEAEKHRIIGRKTRTGDKRRRYAGRKNETRKKERGEERKAKNRERGERKRC